MCVCVRACALSFLLCTQLICLIQADTLCSLHQHNSHRLHEKEERKEGGLSEGKERDGSNKGSEERDGDSEIVRRRVSETDGEERNGERALGHGQSRGKERRRWWRQNNEKEMKDKKTVTPFCLIK